MHFVPHREHSLLPLERPVSYCCVGYTTEVKNEWSYTSVPPYACVAGTGTALPLLSQNGKVVKRGAVCTKQYALKWLT